MALGEARSGSGQNFWSVLAQGLAGGAAAVPNALQQEKQNKLAKMGAIFDAQQMIMAKQSHEQQMALNALRMREANENLKGLVLKNSTYETPEQKQMRERAEAEQAVTDQMSAANAMSSMFPGRNVRVGDVSVGAEPSNKPTQKSWQAILIDSMGVDAFTKWYKNNQAQMKEVTPAWADSYNKYLSAYADMKVAADYTDEPIQPLLSFNEYKAQFGGGAAPVAENPASSEGEGGDEDARLQELLDLISK